MNTEYKGDCIAHEKLTILAGDFSVIQLPLLNHANRAIIQFCIDPDTSAFPLSKIGYVPVANVCEDGTDPGQGHNTKGMALLNFGIYEVIGRKNLKNTKIALFAAGYDLIANINYYK